MQREVWGVSRARSRRYRFAFVLAAVITALALAACGSSSSSSSSASASSSSGGGAATGTSTGSGSSSSSGLATAKSIVDQYSKVPASITVTKPIGKPVPGGKKVVFIDCGIPTCTAVGDSLKQAAETLGWSYSSIAASTTPSAAQKAFEQAIQDKPDAVAFTGIARADINPQLKQLAAMNIPVVTCCTTDATGAGLTNIVRTAASSAASGRLAAAWIVNDSGGKANTLYVDYRCSRSTSRTGRGSRRPTRSSAPVASCRRSRCRRPRSAPTDLSRSPVPVGP